MYLWRRLVTPQWLMDNEEKLRDRFCCNVAIIERPNRKRLQIEIAIESRNDAQELVKKFQGRVEKLPRDWRKRFARTQTSKPLKIGKRLLITNVGGTSVSRVRAGRAVSRHRGPSYIVIPTGAAFGTGDHLTTAMCLRLLERVTRSPDLVVDLGTGSGILALAARRLGAKRVIGIDIDPMAISTAKQNARRNKVEDVQFRIADVRHWKLPRNVDIITVNLFSELLIEILPKLRHVPCLVLSGILREQELEVIRALKRNKIDISEVRRRGKWVAILAGQLRRS